MLQIVHGIEMYIVEFDTMPELPITWKDNQEALYAQALTAAIENGDIVEPGKYGIHIHLDSKVYNIFKIIE